MFPLMHTACSRTACVATLVVAGGCGMDNSLLDTVEIIENWY